MRKGIKIRLRERLKTFNSILFWLDVGDGKLLVIIRSTRHYKFLNNRLRPPPPTKYWSIIVQKGIPPRSCVPLLFTALKLTFLRDFFFSFSRQNWHGSSVHVRQAISVLTSGIFFPAMKYKQITSGFLVSYMEWPIAEAGFSKNETNWPPLTLCFGFVVWKGGG